MKSQIKKLISIFACVCLLLTAIIIPASAADSTTYTFSDYKENTSGSAIKVTEKSKELDETLTAYLSEGSYTTELRIYANHYATFTSTKDITSIVINAGNKNGTFDVYTSTNGSDWVISNENIEYKTSYQDITVTLATAAKHIKISSDGAQIRIKTMTVTFADVTGGEEPACEHTATSTEPNGNETHRVVCGDCGEPITEVVDCTDDDANGECDLCGGDVTITDDGGDEGENTSPTSSETYAFVDYVVSSELGGGAPSRELGDNLTFTISSGWISGDTARIYQNANAIIASKINISSIVINAGYKDSTFDIYTSTDGSEWTMYQEDVAYVTDYSDVTITFETPVKYIKIDAPNKQVRIKTLTVNFAGTAGGNEGGDEPACEHTVTSCEPNGNETHKVVCDDCSETVNPTVDCEDANLDGKCDVCEGNVTAPFDPTGKTPAEIMAYANSMASDETIENVSLAGIISSIDYAYSASSHDISLTFAIDGTDSSLYCFRLTSAEADYETLAGLAAGDTITVTGTISIYNNAPQFSRGAIMSNCIKATPAFDPTGKTAAEIMAYVNTMTAGDTLANVSLTGVVSNIDYAYSATYHNLSLTFAIDGTDSSLYCFRLTSAEADYETLAGLAAGDTITVTGTISIYNNAPQFAAGAIMSNCIKATPEGGEGGDEGGEVTPPAGGEGGNDPVADNAEISFEDVANRTSFSTEQQVWEQNGVTVTGEKDDSTTNVADKSNPARFYKSSKVTIAYPQMTGIVIKADMDTANDKDYTTAWSDSFDASLATATVDGTTVIIALNEAADTFVFDLTAQARAYTITVYTGEFNSDDFIDDTPAFDPAGKTAAEIVDAAYALESGEAMSAPATLTGEIVNIDTPYSSQYENITVTIKVDGADAKKPIMCYRLKGEGANTLANGDIITVTGTLKNFNGTIEFDAGCTLDSLVKGEGEVPTAPEDPKEIVDEAFALEIGKTLPYSATLTGKITKIEKINEEYGDVCLTIAVEGSDGEKELYCYNLKPTEGIDLATLAVGDVITVTGNLKNYNGTIEFISCSFVMANTEGDGTGGTDSDEGTGTGSGTGTGTGTGSGEGTGSSTNTGSDATTGTDTGATTDTTSPDTGDVMGAVVALAMVAGAALVFVNKKRA